MKILLVGEYSRLHNSLKEGLLALGHQVIIISTGDYFKKFPADIQLERRYDSGLTKKLKVLLYLLFGIDITSISLKNQFFKHTKKLQGYDIVQLINETPLGCMPSEENKVISFLKKNNKKVFLLSCGTDYKSVTHALEGDLDYSILEGYSNYNAPKEKYDFALKYITPIYKAHHEFVYAEVAGVIASDMDYHIPLKGHPKYLGLIPNPVNLEKLPFSEVKTDNILVIFMGINRNNYLTKGISYFEKALELIQEKYSEKIRVDIVENLPYSEYIKVYNDAHIVLDQVLSYDQGYNALEAMAKGKVVFTGAEQEFEDFYQLKEQVAVNVRPDAQSIADSLEDLILHPEKVKEIGRNARKFIEREHEFKKVAQRYLDVWNA